MLLFGRLAGFSPPREMSCRDISAHRHQCRPAGKGGHVGARHHAAAASGATAALSSPHYASRFIFTHRDRRRITSRLRASFSIPGSCLSRRFRDYHYAVSSIFNAATASLSAPISSPAGSHLMRFRCHASASSQLDCACIPADGQYYMPAETCAKQGMSLPRREGVRTPLPS